MRYALPKKNQELLLLFIAFIFGFGWAALYVPIIVCYAIFYRNKALSWRMSPMCQVNYLLAIFFTISTYLPGLEYMVVDSPVGTFLVVLLLVGIIIPISNKLSIESSLKLLRVFLLGVFIYVASIVMYSLLTDPVGYSVGSLASPFFDDLRYNTSAFSNYLAIVFCGFLYFILIEKNVFLKLISFVIVFSSLAMAISLGGRAFFIFTFIFTSLILLRINSFKVYLSFAAVILILINLFIYFNNEYEIFSDGLILVFSRGLESTRYEHWLFALQQIPSHPLGGFDVNQQIEEIHSFHNILFDAGKLGGWFPMALFLVICLLNLSIIFSINKSSFHVYFLWVFSLVLMLNMMQDVILEGTYKYFVLFVMLNGIILRFHFGGKNYLSQRRLAIK